MRIIEAGNARAINRLLNPAAGTDRAFERRVQTIVDRVRAGGDRTLNAYARRFDGAAGALEIPPSTIRAGAARVEPAVRRALAQAARNIARVAFKQIPRHVDVGVAAGVTIEQRVEPLARVG